MITPAFIPSPPSNGFSIGPLFFHAYGIAYVVAVAVAIWIVRRRWARDGGDSDLVYNVVWWGFPAGLVGGRIYFDITTPSQMPKHWWGPFAIWDGGMGIWGGVALGVAVGVWYLRRHLSKADTYRFINAAAPSLLVAQAIGRIGNYFNQELFGKPSTLPWALEISPIHRPPGYLRFATFQPTFLYELIWDLAFAGFLIWLNRDRRIRPPGLFPLYIAGYSAFRIYEETLRIDYSQYILGMRLNFWVAIIGTIAGLVWFALIQFRGKPRGSGGGEDPQAATSSAYSESQAG
ncbi:MAG: prolipoprotein diacylglyceryl transferase [Solirubrobacteraceae bacterium]